MMKLLALLCILGCAVYAQAFLGQPQALDVMRRKILEGTGETVIDETDEPLSSSEEDTLDDIEIDEDKRLPRRPMDPPYKRAFESAASMIADLVEKRHNFADAVAAVADEEKRAEEEEAEQKRAEEIAEEQAAQKRADEEAAAEMRSEAAKRAFDSVAGMVADLMEKRNDEAEEEAAEEKRSDDDEEEDDAVEQLYSMKRGFQELMGLTGEEEEEGLEKRKLFECKKIGTSCSGTAFSRCCGELQCHKPKFTKSGTCAMCKGNQSICWRSKECCLGFKCKGFPRRCKLDL